MYLPPQTQIPPNILSIPIIRFPVKGNPHIIVHKFSDNSVSLLEFQQNQVSIKRGLCRIYSA